MAQTINTNIMSLNAQRNLNRSQSDLSQAVQRLSSGLRINSAKDDAAGLAIATRMTTQIGGLSVAIRNANDGISVAQTAEGSMDEMIRNLNRAHDLAIQAASYNTSTDRNSINQEVSQILDEMSRIVNQTRYNGERILTGGFSGDFQIGTSVNETLNIAISNLSPTAMGVASNYSTVSGQSDANLAAQIGRSYSNALSSATVEGFSVANVSAQSASSNKVTALNDVSSSTGVKAFGYGNGLVGASFTGATANVNAIAANALTINGIGIDAVSATTTNSTLADALVTAINTRTNEHGVTAVKVDDLNGDGTAGDMGVVLVNRTGAAITVTSNTSIDADIATFFTAGTSSVSAGANGAIVLNDTLGDTTTTFGAAADARAITGQTSGTTATLADQTVASQTVSTSGSSNLAMLVFESALDSINSQRAIMGAKLNRFEAVSRNLDNVRENISAARSRIQDTDFAEETAKLTRAQILQQAGVAMVAQANALPQTVLSLLQ
ncbi:MAG: flagellin [Gammaproteobacteria bacterium]|nr:flagellin [Gammaproteobacteria bacterium]